MTRSSSVGKKRFSYQCICEKRKSYRCTYLKHKELRGGSPEDYLLGEIDNNMIIGRSTLMVYTLRPQKNLRFRTVIVCCWSKQPNYKELRIPNGLPRNPQPTNFEMGIDVKVRCPQQPVISCVDVKHYQVERQEYEKTHVRSVITRLYSKEVNSRQTAICNSRCYDNRRDNQSISFVSTPNLLENRAALYKFSNARVCAHFLGLPWVSSVATQIIFKKLATVRAIESVATPRAHSAILDDDRAFRSAQRRLTTAICSIQSVPGPLSFLSTRMPSIMAEISLPVMSVNFFANSLSLQNVGPLMFFTPHQSSVVGYSLSRSNQSQSAKPPVSNDTIKQIGIKYINKMERGFMPGPVVMPPAAQLYKNIPMVSSPKKRKQRKNKLLFIFQKPKTSSVGNPQISPFAQPHNQVVATVNQIFRLPILNVSLRRLAVQKPIRQSACSSISRCLYFSEFHRQRNVFSINVAGNVFIVRFVLLINFFVDQCKIFHVPCRAGWKALHEISRMFWEIPYIALLKSMYKLHESRIVICKSIFLSVQNRQPNCPDRNAQRKYRPCNSLIVFEPRPVQYCSRQACNQRAENSAKDKSERGWLIHPEPYLLNLNHHVRPSSSVAKLSLEPKVRPRDNDNDNDPLYPSELTAPMAYKACQIIGLRTTPKHSTPYVFSSLGLRVTARAKLAQQNPSSQRFCKGSNFGSCQGALTALKAGNALEMLPASLKACQTVHDWGSYCRGQTRHTHNKRTDIVKQQQRLCHA